MMTVTRAVLTAALACSASALGCTISESALGSLDTAISQRNAERYREAVAHLGRQGWVRIEDESPYYRAVLERPSLDYCVSYSFSIESVRAEHERVAHLRISEQERRNVGSTPSKPAPSVVDVTAPKDATCAFLRGDRSELTVTKADGTTGILVSTAGPRPLARNGRGQIALVRKVPKFEWRKVVVERTCNEMPRPENSSLLAFQGADNLVWGPAPPRPSIEVRLEWKQEELEVKCTHTEW